MMLQLNNKGMTLAEILMVTAILSFFLSAGFSALFAGDRIWKRTTDNINARANVRQTLQRIASELRESGLDSSGNLQVFIFDGTGPNGTDVIRFSTPILCGGNTSVLDNNGEVAYWGASRIWKCTSQSCMDPDNNCATTDFKFVEYRISTKNELLRRVIKANGAIVKENIFAANIRDLQSNFLSGSEKINISVTGQEMSVSYSKPVTRSMEIYLRNI